MHKIYTYLFFLSFTITMAAQASTFGHKRINAKSSCTEFAEFIKEDLASLERDTSSVRTDLKFDLDLISLNTPQVLKNMQDYLMLLKSKEEECR